MALVTGYIRPQLHGISTPGVTFSVPPIISASGSTPILYQEDFTIQTGTSSLTGVNLAWTPNMMCDREIAVQYADEYYVGRIGPNILPFVTCENGSTGSGQDGFLSIWESGTILGSSAIEADGNALRCFEYNGGGDIVCFGTGPYSGNIIAQAGYVAGVQSSQSGYITFYNASNPYTVTLQATSSSTQSQTYSFPSHYPISNGMVLASTVGGALSWVLNTGGGTGGGGSTSSDWSVLGNTIGANAYVLGTLDNETLNIIQHNSNRISIQSSQTQIILPSGADLFVNSALYNDGLFSINDNGSIDIGDSSIDVNGTNISLNDSQKSVNISSQTLTYGALEASMPNSGMVSSQVTATFSVGVSSQVLANVAKLSSNSVMWVKAYVSGYNSTEAKAYTAELFGGFNYSSGSASQLGFVDIISNTNFTGTLPTAGLTMSTGGTCSVNVTGDNANVLTFVTTYSYQISS